MTSRLWRDRVVVVDAGAPLLCKYLATKSFNSRKTGPEITQDIDKEFGGHSLFDVEALSQIERLVWPSNTEIQEFARLFELQVLGNVEVLPVSFLTVIKYLVLCKLYTSSMPHEKWISFPTHWPETRLLCGSHAGIFNLK